MLCVYLPCFLNILNDASIVLQFLFFTYNTFFEVRNYIYIIWFDYTINGIHYSVSGWYT